MTVHGTLRTFFASYPEKNSCLQLPQNIHISSMFIHTMMKWRLKIKKQIVTYVLYNAGNKYRTIYNKPWVHLWVHTCAYTGKQGSPENRNGLGSWTLYHKLYFTLCFLCSASRRSFSLNGAALGTPGSFLGFLRPRFLASFLTFRWCSLIWRQEQEYFLSLKKKRKGAVSLLFTE